MRDKAYQYLQQGIRSGKLPAGFALSEVSIARELRTGRDVLAPCLVYSEAAFPDYFRFSALSRAGSSGNANATKIPPVRSPRRPLPPVA